MTKRIKFCCTRFLYLQLPNIIAAKIKYISVYTGNEITSKEQNITLEENEIQTHIPHNPICLSVCAVNVASDNYLKIVHYNKGVFDQYVLSKHIVKIFVTWCLGLTQWKDRELWLNNSLFRRQNFIYPHQFSKRQLVFFLSCNIRKNL